MPDWSASAGQLLLAIPLAAFGGNLFLKSVVRIADAHRIPPLLVATTLAAFATSSPEFTVSTVAAMAGRTEIGVGDALGSNVVNLALIFGIVLLWRPVTGPLAPLRREVALALAVPVLTLALAADGELGRLDGTLLLALFGGWIGALLRYGVRSAMPGPGRAAGDPRAARTIAAWTMLPAGLVMLVIAGNLFVAGASRIALSFGLDPYVVGATVVAVGTSLPELVTALLSRQYRYDDIAVGTLLGSNLFNGLAIVGTAIVIHPAMVDPGSLAPALGFGAAAVLLILPRQGSVGRARAPLLLATYVAYVGATVA